MGGGREQSRTLSHACTAHRSGSSSSLCMGWPSSQPLTVTRDAPATHHAVWVLRVAACINTVVSREGGRTSQVEGGGAVESGCESNAGDERGLLPLLTLVGHDTRCTRSAHTSVNMFIYSINGIRYMLYPEVYGVLEHADGSAVRRQASHVVQIIYMILDQRRVRIDAQGSREEVPRLAHATR